MAQISASDVKKLREMTGAGMMDCKKALTEAEGDFDAAVDHLRKKGLSAAAKKAGRVAAEGMVAAVSEGDAGVLVEVNAETDFVSKNDKFRAFVGNLADLVIQHAPKSVQELNGVQYDGENNVGEALNQLIATIGENINIRRFERVSVEGGVVGTYVHGDGRIGVLVGLSGASGDAVAELARGVAMHVAAVNPRYIRREDVPEDVVAREKEVLSERAQASGKPENIVEKIVTGQLNKFYSEICLLEQEYVLDSDLTVGKAVEQAGAEVVAMHRYQLGEGIEKEEDDFAAEVAAQVNG